MWERQKCQGADKRKTRWKRYKRSERVRMMVVGCGRGSLMEMNLAEVEIRWGNCEKMAEVWTRDAALWSWQGHGRKKTR